MKRILLFTMLLTAALGMRAQTANVILFTENGEQFYAILNGLRMNDQPMTNIKISDLNAPNYKLKIIFEDKALGEMNKNLYLEMGSETAFRIKQNKKGDYKLGFVSNVPIAQAPPPPPAQTVIVYGAAPQPAGGNVTVTEQTTTTTTTGGGGTTDHVSMSVGVDGFGMDVNVSASDGGGSMSSHTTTTTTTTTTTSGYSDPGGEVVVVEEAPCAGMSPGDFESAKSSIKSKSFSDSKMTLAKQITKNNCLTSSQIGQITRLFDFEDDRLEFAKFAWHYCYDANNYYKINDAFEFESSIEELDRYINAQR